MKSEDTYLLFLAACNVLFCRKSTHREPSTNQNFSSRANLSDLTEKQRRGFLILLPSKKETSSIRSACESFNFQIEFCQGNFPLPFPARVTRLIDPLESPSTSKSRSLQDSSMTMHRQLIFPLS